MKHWHIAHVNNQAQLGGAETVMNQLRVGAESAGHTVSVHVAEGKTYPEMVAPLYPRWLSRLDHSRLHNVIDWIFPRAAWTDREFRNLSRQSYDLVHIHNFHGTYASIHSLACLAQAKPVLWTFHALWGVTGGCDHPRSCVGYQKGCGRCPQVGRWPIGPTDETADQLELKAIYLEPLPLHVVAPSNHVAETIRRSRVGGRWTVHHIPNGVDLNRFDPNRKHDSSLRAELNLHPTLPIILVVNRNFKDPQKGYDMVEEALCALAPGQFQVVLIGEQSACAAARLAHPCVAVDYVRCPKELARYYNAADYFLFASPAETFPCVVLEAMAAACCVVSTPTNGVLEQIDHGHTGWLAREVNGANLATTLKEALGHSELSRKLGLAARASAEEQFSESVMLQRYLHLYQEVIDAQACPSADTSQLITALAR